MTTKTYGMVTKRIFIVEDHPMMQVAYQRLIESDPTLALCGIAGSAEKALGQVLTLHPDVVVVDVSLKGVDGLELTETLMQYNLDLCIVVVSGHESAALEQEVLRLGAKAYLPKRKIHQLTTLVDTICAR